jgi:hypothetical protein
MKSITWALVIALLTGPAHGATPLCITPEVIIQVYAKSAPKLQVREIDAKAYFNAMNARPPVTDFPTPDGLYVGDNPDDRADVMLFTFRFAVECHGLALRNALVEERKAFEEILQAKGI